MGCRQVWSPPAIAQHLPADVLADGRGAVQLQQHVGLQQVLGPVHLELGEGGAHPHPLVLDVVHHVLLVHRVSHEVDPPQAGVLVAGVEGLEAVAEALLGAVVGQVGAVVGAAAHGAVPVADESVGDHEGDVVGVGPAAALHRDGHVGQGHAVVTHPHVAASVPGDTQNIMTIKSFISSRNSTLISF